MSVFAFGLAHKVVRIVVKEVRAPVGRLIARSLSKGTLTSGSREGSSSHLGHVLLNRWDVGRVRKHVDPLRAESLGNGPEVSQDVVILEGGFWNILVPGEQGVYLVS